MINWGTLLLNCTLLFSVISIILLLYREFSRTTDTTSSAKWTIRISVLLSVCSMLLLIYHFISSNFMFVYVTQNSSTQLSTFYKLAATIAVQDGALLFWAALVFLQVLWVSEKYDPEKPFFRRMLIIMLSVGALFTYIIVNKSSMYPFLTWHDIYGNQIAADYTWADGAGLRPILKDPIMAIHPPFQFLAYAATLIPFAAALSHLLTPGMGKSWERIQRQWSRFCWFSLSLTLVIGGAWIYQLAQWGTLSGTGNIWAWDPYETTPFIVWLILTIFLHMAYKYRTGDQYEHLTPMFAALTFISSLYAGWVARSGAVSSTHDVGKLPSADIFFWVTVLLFAGVVYLIYLKLKNLQDEETSGPLFTYAHLFDLTAFIFVILTFIAFFGISAPIFQKIMWHLNAVPTEREFYNTLAYPFTMLLMIVIGICLPYRRIVKKIGTQKYLIAAASVLALSIILAFVVPGPEFYVINHSSTFYRSASGFTQLLGSVSLLSYVPIFIFSLAAIIYKFSLDVNSTKDRKRLLKPAGINLIHLGTILLLLGVIVSQSFDVTFNINYEDSKAGEIQTSSIGLLDDFGTKKTYTDNPLGFQLIMDGSSPIHRESTSDRMVVGQTKNAFYIKLYRGQREISSGAVLYWAEKYDENLDGVSDNVDWTEIMDDENLITSYHVKYSGRSANGYSFVVKVIPLISLVWIGAALMCIGIILTFADQQLFGAKEKIDVPKEKIAGNKGQPKQKTPDKSKKSVYSKYDNMLKEELESSKK